MKFDTPENDSHADATTQAQSRSESKSESQSQANSSTTQNPVLNFVLNVGETAQYVWVRYLEWIIDVSWGKALLAGLLTLILGAMLSLHAFANLLVLGSLLLKCFIGKESDSEVKTKEHIDRPEES